MKRVIAAVALLGLAVIVAGCGHFPPSQGWVTLIDGDKGMEHWNKTGSDANWRAEGGAIQADKSTGKGSSVLVSKQSFKDFDLYCEFWASEDTNSGIYIRIMKPTDVSTSTGAYEVQIWDKNPNPAYGTGSLVNVAEVKPIYKAGGRWNTYEIIAKGSQLTVKLNGVTTVDVHDRKLAAGPFALQYGPGVNNAQGGPIKWRKVQIRSL